MAKTERPRKGQAYHDLVADLDLQIARAREAEAEAERLANELVEERSRANRLGGKLDDAEAKAERLREALELIRDRGRARDQRTRSAPGRDVEIADAVLREGEE
jgi:hypothetical protein